MDISCIISSGDLELYVLGMLSQEDNAKVAQLAQLFPEIKHEIDEIQQSLLQVSDEADAADLPSSSVRDALFAKLNAIPPASDTPAASDSDTAGRREAPVVPMRPAPKRTFTTISLAASIIALIACIAVILHLSSANTHYHQVANNLQEQITDLQQRAQTQNQNLALYQDTSYQKINLTHAPGKPDALAQIFWNRTTKRVYVADISLPNAPTGKRYQLWAIVDGKPVNAGMINTKKVPQQMFDFAAADAFAITLENSGGSPTPHLDQLFVIGKTS